jgi:hypothetical protein
MLETNSISMLETIILAWYVPVISVVAFFFVIMQKAYVSPSSVETKISSNKSMNLNMNKMNFERLGNLKYSIAYVYYIFSYLYLALPVYSLWLIPASFQVI